VLLFLLSCFTWGSKRNEHISGSKSHGFKYCTGKECNVAHGSQFSQHEASTLLSDIFLGSLLHVFTVLRITCGPESSVSEEYTACIFS
jgi:hypothetical protein